MRRVRRVRRLEGEKKKRKSERRGKIRGNKAGYTA